MITTMQQMADDIIRNRADNLLKRIKLETHWNLVSAPVRNFPIDESGYATDRAALVATWPDIRHRRVSAAFMLGDVIAEQASLLTHLVEIRRQRAAKKN